jgi:hypothetical protein
MAIRQWAPTELQPKEIALRLFDRAHPKHEDGTGPEAGDGGGALPSAGAGVIFSAKGKQRSVCDKLRSLEGDDLQREMSRSEDEPMRRIASKINDPVTLAKVIDALCEQEGAGK